MQTTRAFDGMPPKGGAMAAGLALGWIADQVLGDPRRGHPVAGFGRIAAALEARVHPEEDVRTAPDVPPPPDAPFDPRHAAARAPNRALDERLRGVGFEVVLVGGAWGLGRLIESALRGRPLLRLAATAAATWTVLGGRSLTREGASIAAALSSGDLAEARRRVGYIVSRDPDTLDAAGIARAALESVAENTSDAVVGPLFWGAVAGVPGLLAYRAVNTLDAMVGYRNERYVHFGWAAARVDDVANWVPARLTSALTIAAAPLVGGSPAVALRAVREHSGAHPSPNGGVVEAAFAGALGIRLGGRNVYGGVEEDRGELGFGPPPGPDDLGRANRLATIVSAASVVACAALSAIVWPRLRRIGPPPGRGGRMVGASGTP